MVSVVLDSGGGGVDTELSVEFHPDVHLFSNWIAKLVDTRAKRTKELFMID